MVFRISSSESGKYENAIFQYTFEIESDVQGISTDLGYFNLKKSDKFNVDLNALNERLSKGDLIEVEIIHKTKSDPYPKLRKIKKGEDIIWHTEDVQSIGNYDSETKQNNRKLLFLMVISVIGYIIAKLSEQRLKTNKCQIITLPKERISNDIYLKKIHNFSFSICNNEFIVFSNHDRINRNEILTHNRTNGVITLNGIVKRKSVKTTSINYLIFQYEFINAKQTYYESEFYFQTNRNELIHIVTLTSSHDIRLSNHQKTDFYKDMLKFAILICQELDLKLKNTSNIKIQPLTRSKNNLAKTGLHNSLL